MRTVFTLLLIILLVGCQAQDSDKAAAKKEKSSAEKAFDAGQRARKKAEAIKAEQEKKNKETNDAGN